MKTSPFLLLSLCFLVYLVVESGAFVRNKNVNSAHFGSGPPAQRQIRVGLLVSAFSETSVTSV